MIYKHLEKMVPNFSISKANIPNSGLLFCVNYETFVKTSIYFDINILQFLHAVTWLVSVLLPSRCYDYDYDVNDTLHRFQLMWSTIQRAVNNKAEKLTQLRLHKAVAAPVLTYSSSGDSQLVKLAKYKPSYREQTLAHCSIELEMLTSGLT